MMACARCSRENRAGAIYCDACGAVLASRPLPASDALPTPLGADTVFVGREQDLSVLHTSVEKALAGQGRIAAVAGEPGIGKTRIAQVLSNDAAALGFTVLWGRCHEEPGSPPYWPWVQVLREYVAMRDAEHLRATFGPSA